MTLTSFNFSAGNEEYLERCAGICHGGCSWYGWILLLNFPISSKINMLINNPESYK